MDATIVQAVLSGILIGMIYALIAAGLSLIFGLMEIVNFAHGEFLMLAMFSSFWMWELWQLDPLTSLPITAALMFGVGVLTNRLLVMRVLNAPALAQIFATFGLGLFLRAGAQYLWSADFRSIQDPFLSRIVGGRIALGRDVFIGVPQLVAAVIAAVAFALLGLLIGRTRLGLALQAVAEDRSTAALMGIPAGRMFDLGWGIAAACVGIAGAVLASFYYIYPSVGVTFALLAYIIVALGGFGSITGALIAGILVGLVEIVAPLLLGIPPAYKYALVFTLYLLVVLVRPQGLFGRY
ncbi:MAG: branched-chain amino acid ABC transporter permease [Oscillochloridaceae bacterium]|nr:branched-chain amino acid ABC transporter permease [Chloroflexaceae bacterium]MDW8390893.1 branched-chain amino acid ABC transporter permease [Oscillochloridaceae bacterium]